MKMTLHMTCKEACALITTRGDRHLSLADRLRLRLHLVVCEACPTFDRQIELLNKAMGRWRGYVQRDE